MSWIYIFKTSFFQEWRSISTGFQLCLRSQNECFLGPNALVSDFRGRIQSETIEILKCLKSWFRLGVFTKEDLHAIFGNMEDEAMKAFSSDRPT